MRIRGSRTPTTIRWCTSLTGKANGDRYARSMLGSVRSPTPCEVVSTPTGTTSAFNTAITTSAGGIRTGPIAAAYDDHDGQRRR